LRTNYISVDYPPVADFEADQTTIFQFEFVTFTDLSTGNPTSWTWTFEGGDPAGSNIQQPGEVTYEVNGVYDVTLTVSNDYGQSTETKTDYIDVLPVGIDEINSGQGFTIYPNPGREVFMIHRQSNTDYEIRIFNLLGEQVFEGALNGQEARINLSGLNRGLYIVRLAASDSDQVATAKLVIE
ncbi:MAG: T9SS type A sorting domain-containing protein, partial [Bacteroidetes bacterium]|nr:T9SS type A sorting domain-containing protein [Bacteroidota bacterium]